MILCNVTPERTVHTYQHSGSAYCPHHILPWKQKLQVLPKLRYISTKLYGGHNPEGCNLNVQGHGNFHLMNVAREKNLAMLHVPYEHFQWTLTSISWLFHEKSISQCQMYQITTVSNAYPIQLTWCALQIKSKSCLCKNLATTSAPNVNDTPLSFSPQPIVSCQAKENGLFKQILQF